MKKSCGNCKNGRQAVYNVKIMLKGKELRPGQVLCTKQNKIKQAGDNCLIWKG